jgi:hypothetical protein
MTVPAKRYLSLHIPVASKFSSAKPSGFMTASQDEQARAMLRHQLANGERFGRADVLVVQRRDAGRRVGRHY